MFSRFVISALLLVVIISSLTTLTTSAQQATTGPVAFTTQRTLFSLDVTVNQAGQRSCWFVSAALNFTAGHGDRIMGSFTSDRPVSFYAMSEAYAKSWGSGTGASQSCYPSGTPDQVLVSQPDSTSFSIDFTINNAGNYRFTFINFNKSNAAHVNFNAGIVGS